MIVHIRCLNKLLAVFACWFWILPVEGAGKPNSPAVKEAAAEYQHAVTQLEESQAAILKDAMEVRDSKIKSARAEYVGKLERALDAAMAAKNVDEAARIDLIIKQLGPRVVEGAAQDAPPKTPAVKQATMDFEHQLKVADQQYAAALKRADVTRQAMFRKFQGIYVAKLKTAMNAAMTAKDLDEAKAINSLIKTVATDKVSAVDEKREEPNHAEPLEGLINFCADLKKAELTPGLIGTEYFLTKVKVDGKVRPAIMQRPPVGAQNFDITFDVAIPRGISRLSLSTMVPENPKDGTLTVTLLIDGDLRFALMYKRASNEPKPHEVDLSEFAGKKIKVTFRTNAGGSNDGDRVAWINPHIYVVEEK